MRCTTASSAIASLKQVFSGVPKTVMTDNGPPFSSKEFDSFACKYCFDHLTSSPRYPQSNGLIERMVQTVKQCMKKCSAAGQDPDLAMLVYRTTPLTSSIPSPAELLNGRKYRALLPARSLMQNAYGQIVREQMVEDKNKASVQSRQVTTSTPNVLHDRSSINERPRRVINKPKRLTETI